MQSKLFIKPINFYLTMAVKIRLQRKGTKKRPFYYVVSANSSSPRDGKFIEKLGTYNPLTVPATIVINRERSLYWLEQGAIPSDTVNRILSFKGVLFLKHLHRGIKLGLFDKEKADEKFAIWLKEHEEKIAHRQARHKASKKDKAIII